MTYKFIPGVMYRMPTHFGPSLGPRQGVDGRRFLNENTPKRTIISVSFLTDKNLLEALLPKGFELISLPVVTVQFQYITEIEWLAGRGYNVVGVSFPALYNVRKQKVVGDFLAVLWENLADPIITGREELGFSKIYCEIPEIRKINGKVSCTAEWLGFKFLDLEISEMVQVSPDKPKSSRNEKKNDGILHYKYIPKTENWGEPDAEYAVLTPIDDSNIKVTEAWIGQGMLKFHQASWEDLPTMFNIVNILKNLITREYCDAKLTVTVGGTDLRNQRILS